MPQVNVGFPNFALLGDDPDKVIRAGLMDAGPSEATGLGGGVLQDALAKFTPNGMNVNGGKPVSYSGIALAIAQAMKATFTFSCMVDSGWLSAITSGAQYLWSLPGGGTTYFSKEANGRMLMTESTTADNLGATVIAPEDKPAQSRIVIMGDANFHYLYVDDLLIFKHTRVINGIDAAWQTPFINGLTSAALGPDGYSVKNAVMLKRIQNFVESLLQSVVLLGSSYIANAGPADYVSGVNNNVSWYPGNGFQGDGVTPSVPSNGISAPTGPTRGDNGYVCQVFRQLSKAGFWPTNNVNASVAGGRVSDAITKWGQLIAGSAPFTKAYKPEAGIGNLGTNECADGGGFATFAADYLTLLTLMERAGLRYFVAQTVLMPTTGFVSYSAAVVARVVSANLSIKALPAAAAAIGLKMVIDIDDIFPVAGGLVSDPALFQADGLHPNAILSSKIGLSGGGLLAKRLLGSSSRTQNSDGTKTVLVGKNNGG